MAFQKNKSIEDALKVLMEIAGEEDSCGSRELSRRLGMDPTRVNRFLKTLHAAGFLEQDWNQRYHPGAGMEVLSAQCLHGSRLLRASLPVFAELIPADFTIATGVLHRDQVSYLFHASPGISIAEGVGKLKTFPAIYSSIGMVLSSLKPMEFVEELYKDMKPVPGYIGGYPELMKMLDLIRKQGCATLPSFGEPGFYTMAVPVGTPVIGAIAFAKVTEENIASKQSLLWKQAEKINNAINSGSVSDAAIDLQYAV